MIALYFTVEPEAADSFLKQVEEWEAEEQERLYDALVELEERDNYWR